MAHRQWGALMSAARSGLKRHPKSVLLVVSLVLAWLTLWVVLWWWTECLPPLRPWIETLNGATWSDEWERLWSESPFWFAGAIATRTAINFAGPIGVLVTLAWFLVGLERFMYMSRLELLTLLNAELVPTLAAVLKRRSHVISDEDKAEMRAAADELIKDFVKDAEEISDKQGDN
ncbi:hypothetical protein [Caldimonas sp. KR1-144]|uniref:hypothetical protein n=1 Tax=Caldimonas sp. KR1-144 TaxID=3400911 RepID=UPI003C051A8C